LIYYLFVGITIELRATKKPPENSEGLLVVFISAN
jgi:hypothetical protein